MTTQYLDDVSTAGYEVDTDRAGKAVLTNLKQASTPLAVYTQALRGFLLGMDEADLLIAAALSNVDDKDVAAAVTNAQVDSLMDYRYENTVLAKVVKWREQQTWLETVPDTLKAEATVICDWVAAKAVEQNNLQPQVVQSDIAKTYGFDAMRISRLLTVIETKHKAVKKIARQGRQANGYRHANNYELVL